MPWKVFREDGRYCVHKTDSDGRKGEKVKCHDDMEAAEEQVQALYANVQEMQSINDVLVVWELRGSYPDVPLAPDVDYEALIAGDNDPVFLTLPVGKAGVTSGNKRHYDAAFVQELGRQALANKPIGLMGHLKPEDRATAMPAEAVHWVGIKEIDGMLWAKGYLAPGPARDRIRRYKAAGKKIATSIDAFAKGVWDEALGAYKMLADSLTLNQIDIAPADRAGIPDLAAVPILTTEMNDNEEPEPIKETTMSDRIQIIREMTPEDADLLPKPVREAILATVPAPEPAPEIALVTELRQALGVDEKADLTAVVTKMKQQQEEQQQAAVTRRITELVEDKEKGIKVETMRGIVAEMVANRKPQTAEEAEQAYQTVIEMEHVKAALKAHVQETMGPPQRTPVQSQNGKAQYFNVPEKETS